MSSIIEGYNYDIFISYRQKDNKHDGWVTEFVNNLKGELESTFKEEISVYFDINPHDGLLETHDVNESLKEKLKCLIFIPIISRTYCDPKSFAWEHEFKAFVEKASKDQFGLKVKLPNGNVSSRVLPVRIHELENEDIKTCESLLGSVLRGVEFIYKEPGVNRPLSHKDYIEKNINGISYKNQINKVANTIKEIIKGLQNNSPLVSEHLNPLIHTKQNKTRKEKILKSTTKYLVFFGFFLIVLVYIVFNRFISNESLEDIKLSGHKLTIVVLPFQNLTNDQEKNFWRNAIQENITTFLSNFQNDLNIRQPETVNKLVQNQSIDDYSSISPSLARKVFGSLNVNLFVTGNFQQSGKKVYASAKLIEAQTYKVLKTFEIEIDNSEESLRALSDALRKTIADYLVLSNLARGMTSDYQYMTTSSPDAYNYYIEGEKAFNRADVSRAEKNYSLAIWRDSDYLDALLSLSLLYSASEQYDKAVNIYRIAESKKLRLAPIDQIKMQAAHAMIFESMKECITYAMQALEIDDQLIPAYGDLGEFYINLGEYENAISILEKGIEVFNRSGSRHIWGIYLFNVLGNAYHKTHQYKKEERLFRKAEKLFPPDHRVAGRQLTLALIKGEIIKAANYLEKFRQLASTTMTKEDMAVQVARYYANAGKLDEAEEYYRTASQSKPDDPDYLNKLAFFLIDNDRKTEEGLQLVERALCANPKDFRYLDTKAWGLYRQGKYNDCLKILQKADSLKPVYSLEIAIHMDSVIKALARSN